MEKNWLRLLTKSTKVEDWITIQCRVGSFIKFVVRELEMMEKAAFHPKSGRLLAFVASTNAVPTWVPDPSLTHHGDMIRPVLDLAHQKHKRLNFG